MEKKIIVVTGGSSGLGLEIVRDAHRRGFFVCNLSQSEEKMAHVRAEFPDYFLGIAGDLTNPVFVQNAVSRIAQEGHIWALVNCAERAVFKAPADYTSEDLDLSFQGLRSMILTTTEVLKASEEQDVRVVNILSSAARAGKPKEALYCSAKWGERGYTEALKAAYAGTSVKVYAVYPSGMNTALWDSSRDYVSVEKASTFMDPAAVASLILDTVAEHDNLYASELVIERR